jgi:hypothetical protein
MKGGHRLAQLSAEANATTAQRCRISALPLSLKKLSSRASEATRDLLESHHPFSSGHGFSRAETPRGVRGFSR